MTNLEKIEEMMKNDPSLQEKLAAETKRLTDSGEKDLRKISAEAIKATFGTDLTDEELDQVTKVAAEASKKASTKLDLDELDNVAGGGQVRATCYGAIGAVVGAVFGSDVLAALGPVGIVAGVVGGAAAGGAIGAAIGYASDD